MGSYFYDARILIVPLFYFCIAHSQPYIGTLILALVTGILWDAENIIRPFQDTVEIEVDSVDNLKFGYSVFIFGAVGFMIAPN